MPILETLAAQADYDDDVKFNDSADAAQCTTTITGIRDGGNSGIKNETLTGGPRTVTNDEAAKLAIFAKGIIDRTSLSQLDASLQSYM